MEMMKFHPLNALHSTLKICDFRFSVLDCHHWNGVWGHHSRGYSGRL